MNDPIDEILGAPQPRKKTGQSALPKETTPRRRTRQIDQLCRRIAPGETPQFVPVRPFDAAEPNNSYGNVQTQVGLSGGESQGGWLIWEIRDVLLNAERFACWRSPEGELLDVTPKPDGERRVLFLPDATPWDGARTMPQLAALRSDPRVRAYVDAVLAERKQWVAEVEDRDLQRKCYDALVSLHAMAAEENLRKRK